MEGLTIVEHPLVQHKVSLMRDKICSAKDFRELFSEIGALLCFEATRDLPLETIEIETPLAKMKTRTLLGNKVVLAPIGRAGTGFLDGVLKLIPTARVAHVGLYREPRTLAAVEYFFKVPDEIGDCLTFVLHPMLATGNTAVAAVELLKESGARAVRILCTLVTAAAVEKVRAHHPDVEIYAVAIDDGITADGYIVPGLGDVGDRMYKAR